MEWLTPLMSLSLGGQAQSPQQQLGPAFATRLCQEVRHVRFNCAGAEHQTTGDASVAVT